MTFNFFLVETTDLPNEKRKNTGIVMLGYLEDGNEHLDIRQFSVLWYTYTLLTQSLGHPLATGFRIDQGYVLITVPRRIAERNDYICVGESFMQTIKQKKVLMDDAFFCKYSEILWVGFIWFGLVYCEPSSTNYQN